MEALWRSRAESKQWDEVNADLGVYRLLGQSVKEDPRRSSDYRNQVVEGPGFGKDASEKRPGIVNFSVMHVCIMVPYGILGKSRNGTEADRCMAPVSSRSDCA